MTTAYRDAVLADTPQLYYRLGDAVGANPVVDSSGNSRSGTPNNVTFGSNGIADDLDTAATFASASNSNIATSYNPGGQSAFTLEFWFQASSNNMGIFSAGNTQYFQVAFNSSNQLQMVFSTNLITAPVFYFSPSGMSLNQWYHVVYTYDSATNTWLLYIDGQQQGVANYSWGGTLSFNGNNLRIGQSTNSWGNTFSGRLDEVAWYNYALSPTRVLAHYNAALSTAISRPRVRVPYLYAEQVVKAKPRVRIPYMYAEQVVKPRPRVRLPYLYAEQLLVKAPVPTGYYANILDAATADFETGSLGGLQSPGYPVTPSVATTVAYGSGTHSGQLFISAGSGQNDLYASVGGDTGAIRLGMVPGYKYTFSCYVYVPAGSDPTIVPHLEFYDNDGTGYQSTVASPAVQYGQWYRMSVSRTVRSGATEAFIRIYVGVHGGPAINGGSIYVDKLMLDPSTSAGLSPWQPGGFQGYLVNTTGSSARSRGVATANAVNVAASVTAYENVTGTAARSRGSFGLASLYSSTATPINVSGAGARSRGASGTAQLKVANDNLVDAAALVLASTAAHVSSAYTTQIGEPYAQYYTGWWKFTAAATGVFAVQVGGSYYVDVNIYAGPSTNPTFAALTWVVGDQNSYSVYIGTQTYNVNVTAGTTYYLQLQSYYGSQLDATIGITPPPIIINAGANLTRHRTVTAVRTALTARLASITAPRTRSINVHAALGTIKGASTSLPRTRTLTAHGVVQHFLDATATLTRHRSVTANHTTATPPANDKPGHAVQLTGQTGSVSFSTVAATLDSYDPALPDVVTDPVGSVWFTWTPPVQGEVQFTSTAGTGLDAFATSNDWITIDYDTYPDNWFAGAYLKVYRVHIPTDMTQVLTWSGPTQGPVQDFQLDFYLTDPGDLTAPTFSTNPDLLIWSARAGHYPEHTGAFGAYPAGDYLMAAVQWDNTLPVDPWDPSTSFGTFTDPHGNPVAAPFTVVEHVLLGFSASPLATPVGGGDGTVTFTTRDGEIYAIRAYGMTVPDEASGLTLNYAMVNAGGGIGRPINVVLTSSTVTTTPTALTLYVAAETPGETLTVKFLGDTIVLATAVVADDGTSTISVPLGAMGDGDYSLLVTSDTGGVTVLPFSVASTVVDTGTDPADPPPPPIDPAPVSRWQLQDPVTGATWAFPINPFQSESTMMPRNITSKETTAIDGQPLVFEGAKRAKAWQFKGHLLTLADRATLEAWVAKPYRIYLTDDFGRAFVVKLKQAQMTPVRDLHNPEHHTYTVAALLYGRAS